MELENGSPYTRASTSLLKEEKGWLLQCFWIFPNCMDILSGKWKIRLLRFNSQFWNQCQISGLYSKVCVLLRLNFYIIFNKDLKFLDDETEITFKSFWYKHEKQQANGIIWSFSPRVYTLSTQQLRIVYNEMIPEININLK